MIIYPLPAKELDDKTLSKQIKYIAQVLCNVHHLKADYDSESKINYEEYRAIVDVIPLEKKQSWEKPNFESWTLECRANYLKLVELGIDCCKEHKYRFIRYAEKHKDDKYFDAIWWANANVPELPREIEITGEDKKLYKAGYDCKVFKLSATPFPLVIKEIYWQWDGEEVKKFNLIESYRNYYKAKLKKKLTNIKFTRRETPDYIKDLIGIKN